MIVSKPKTKMHNPTPNYDRHANIVSPVVRSIRLVRSLSANRGLLAALILTSASGLIAQTAPAPSAAANTGDTIKLNPFEVTTEKDDGFSAQSMGTASRLALELKDTPVAYSVLNREFIEALGIHDVQEAATWSTNTTSFSDGNGADTFSHPIVVRGNQQSELYGASGTGSLQRNFYQNVSLGDSYSVETFEFSRGPNAALFSTGNLGGQQITQSKKARLDRGLTTITTEIGSWDYYRATVDLNRPLNDRVGIRINAVDQDARGWAEGARNIVKGMTATATLKLTNSTNLTVEGVVDYQSRHNPQILFVDNFSGWDGSTVFRGPITNAMVSTNGTAGSPNALGQSLTFNGEPQGIDRLGTNYYIYDGITNKVMNWQNMARTRKADSTSRTPLWTKTAPNGVAFVRADNPTAIAANSAWNFGYTTFGSNDEQNILHQPAGTLPADRFDRAINNSRFRVPGMRFRPEFDTPQQIQRSRDLNVGLTQQVGSDLYIQLGGDINQTLNKNIGITNTRFSLIDVNQLLPDGSPNSHYLDAYGDTNSGPFRDPNSWTNFTTYRANVAYVKDLGAWGNYTFNLNVTSAERFQKTRTYELSLMLNADRRLWSSDTIRGRIYWNDPASRQFVKPDKKPVSFTQVDWTNPNAPAVQAAVQKSPGFVLSNWSERKTKTDSITLQTSAKYFDGKLAFTGAIRRDSYETANKSSLNLGDLPANWDNNTPLWRPDAPADYWKLTYVPRNQTTGVATSGTPVIVTGNRPRTTINGLAVRNQFFATDRFRDDFNAPVVSGTSSNPSVGLVWHAHKMISPFVNYSTSYDPPGSGGNGGTGTALDMFGEMVRAQSGVGMDAGANLTFLNGRLTAKLSYYKNTQKNNGYNPPTNAQINALINANPADDANVDAVNGRGIGPLPGNDYSNIRNDGQEFEIAANITGRWRMTLNGGWGHHVTTNFGELTKKYVPANADMFKLLLEDAGGMLDTTQKPQNAPAAPGLAVANPAAANPHIDQTNAINAYNAIWVQYNNVISAKDIRYADQPSVNFFTDYTIGTGKLKGLRLGVGAQWQGSIKTGDRSGDTIIDPTNPLRAIDNPNLGTSDIVYNKGYTLTTGTLAYTLRPSWLKGKELSFNLRIKNLLGDNTITYQGIPDNKPSLRQPQGDLTKPDRRAIGTQPNRYPEPRSFFLTTALKL